MNITGILIAVACIGGVGLFIGVFLGIAGRFFSVETDPREDEVLEALPGNNCGGCGYAGCSGLAAAIAKGEAPVNACPVGGDDVAKIVAAIMGEEVGESVRQVAFVKCAGTCELTTQDYNYVGIEDCKMLSFVPNGGAKTCNHGCLGFGSCVKVCPFDAITIIDGVAVVDAGKCKACGKCVAECPKHLIELVPDTAKYLVKCSSTEKGPVTMKECKVGCIGCGLCVKECEQGAITVTDFVAHIDPDKCINCGKCAEKCPKKIIRKQENLKNRIVLLDWL